MRSRLKCASRTAQSTAASHARSSPHSVLRSSLEVWLGNGSRLNRAVPFPLASPLLFLFSEVLQTGSLQKIDILDRELFDQKTQPMLFNVHK
jgi:hypothetical protein